MTSIIPIRYQYHRVISNKSDKALTSNVVTRFMTSLYLTAAAVLYHADDGVARIPRPFCFNIICWFSKVRKSHNDRFVSSQLIYTINPKLTKYRWQLFITLNSTVAACLSAMASCTWEDFLKWKWQDLPDRKQTMILKLLGNSWPHLVRDNIYNHTSYNW